MSDEVSQTNISTHASSPVPPGSTSSNPQSVDSENQAVGSSQVLNQRNKKLTSDVWKDFNREVHPDSSIVATCIHCKRKFDAGSSKGTSHLKNHRNSCKRKPKGGGDDIRQTILGMVKSPSEPIPKFGTHKFDPEMERTLFAQMVARHDYPFLMAEHEYFRYWISYCCPTYKCRSRGTVKNDLKKSFKVEKEKLYKSIESLPSRVSLTTDIWTPKHQGTGYCCLTCHYIDGEWKLNKKIIAFCWIQCPHDAENVAEWIKTRILEWNIDKKLMAMVVDNASYNKPMVDHIKSWLNGKKALLQNGDMFHTRCNAHIINLIVKNGLKVIDKFIERIRNSVKHVGSSLQRNQTWEIALRQTRLNSKKNVELDCQTRWNATYLMLESAIEVRAAFERLAELDSDYEWLPSDQDWERGKTICECLKIFYDMTNRLSGTKYPTANYYFNDVCQINYQLMQWQQSNVEYIRLMALNMQVKFDKYWEDCSLVLTIGLVLDPRYKMEFVQFAYYEIYGSTADVYIHRVRTTLYELYAEYKKSNAESVTVGDRSEHSSRDVDNEHSSVTVGFTGGFKKYIRERSGASFAVQKSELEQYLEETLFPLDEHDELKFDILHWWKLNGPKFPTLAKMACDILAIPVTTVASESAFSWGRRIVDDTRSSLTSETVDTLICTKDWLPSVVEHLKHLKVATDDEDKS